MKSFPSGFRALVIGSSGAIGSAFASLLQAHPGCAGVDGIHRNSQPAIDFADEASIAAAAASLARHAPYHLIINAAGLLHAAGFMPEKRLASLNYDRMFETFHVNPFGPAMLLRHFLGLLDGQRGVLAVLSAKVGSIEDHRLGGWYS